MLVKDSHCPWDKSPENVAAGLGRLSAPTFCVLVYWLLLYAQCTVATSFYLLAGHLWPLCIPSTVSTFCSFGLWSPGIVIHAVGMAGWSAVQDCFPSLGSVWPAPKGSLSARGTLPPGVGCGFVFLFLYFATHQQQFLLLSILCTSNG